MTRNMADHMQPHDSVLHEHSSGAIEDFVGDTFAVHGSHCTINNEKLTVDNGQWITGSVGGYEQRFFDESLFERRELDEIKNPNILPMRDPGINPG